MNANFTLEDIINALKLVGDNGRADELTAEILGVSTDKLWEIEIIRQIVTGNFLPAPLFLNPLYGKSCS